MIPVHALQVVNDLLLTLVGASDARELTAAFMQRLMYHTGYPVACLMAHHRVGWSIEQSLGNRELARSVGQSLSWVETLAVGPSEAFAIETLGEVFDGASRYRHGLRLNVGTDLALVLLGPTAPAHAQQLPGLFEIVLPRLDKARRLLLERAEHQQQVSAEIERRRRAEASHRDSEAQAHALLDLSPQPMLVIDLDSRQCQVINARARELLGLGTTQGLSLRGIFERTIPDPGYRAEVRARLRAHTIEASRRGGLLEPLAVRIRNASGGELHAEIHARVVSGRALVSILDVTERLRDEESLRASKDLAEKLSDAKSQFLSSVGHELRAPLHVILESAKALAEAYQDPHTRRRVQDVQEAGELLLALADDVQDLGRLQAGRVALEPHVVRLDAVMRAVLEGFASRAAARQVTLEVDGDWNCAVSADPGRLHQVLENLVGHAIRYNVTGGRVTLSCERSEQAGRTRIAVSDSAPATSDPRLGKPFGRICAQDDNAQGSGIGPFVAKQLVELMGGTTGYSSQPGQGCTFWFELPAPLAGVEVESPEVPQLLRVLIAEDQPINQRLLKLQLEQVGRFDVVMVTNGLDALRHLAEREVDILLTDCNMPLVDGYRLAELVRDEEVHFGGHLPIIAITASAIEEDVQRCLVSGMDACLAKPLSVGALSEALARWRPARPGTSARRTRREGYLAAIGSMVGELGPEALEALLDDFMTSTSVLIEEARRHLASGAAIQLGQTMHKVKPTAVLVGAKSLAAAAELIERAGKVNDLGVQREVWPAFEHLWQRVVEDLASIPAPSAPVENHPTPAQDDGLHELRALVIDDDPFTTRYVSNMLSELGVARVGVAEDGASALQRLQNDDSVDVVLCDLAMPGMDGIELLRHLAARKQRAGFIFMSGAGERVLESVEALARQHGFSVLGTLKKPVGREALATLLRRHRPPASRKAARVQPQTALGQSRPAPAPSREPARVTPEDVAHAIAARHIIVHLQPKVRADSLQPVGVEALARWFRPDGTSIPPGVFIPIVESLGLQDALFELVLEQSLAVSRRLAEQGYPLKVSVNVSAQSLEHLEFVNTVLDRTHANGVDPRRLVLEVTETGLVRDQKVALDVLTRLRLHGIELSIDDFGTGYSSIDLLRRVPFTELKVDRSFVMTCVRDQSARHIISSSIGLARGLGMMVVAEGVETATELATVRELGCDEIQGYYTGRPMAEEALLPWLAEHMRPLSPLSAF